ncbi:hypothetical protein [Legionella saoudiensis]|uniref:hypothetical protein n=1 Tax=Legionella saoudiensis TaxID=1750561 RepID=UPI0007314AF0|nr:hypothetical protein [Legionella saoudiensis]
MEKEEVILDEFFKYCEEQKNNPDRNAYLPLYVTFAELKTQQGLYYGLTQFELNALLKKLLSN